MRWQWSKATCRVIHSSPGDVDLQACSTTEHLDSLSSEFWSGIRNRTAKKVEFDNDKLMPWIQPMLTSLERHSSEGLKQTKHRFAFRLRSFDWSTLQWSITIITPFTGRTGHVKGRTLWRRMPRPKMTWISRCKGLKRCWPSGTPIFAKILCMALWYCSIFSGVLFIGSFVFGIIVTLDGFCLMWAFLTSEPTENLLSWRSCHRTSGQVFHLCQNVNPFQQLGIVCNPTNDTRLQQPDLRLSILTIWKYIEHSG